MYSSLSKSFDILTSVWAYAPADDAELQKMGLLDDWQELKDICLEQSLSVFFLVKSFDILTSLCVWGVSALPCICQSSLRIQLSSINSLTNSSGL